MAKDVIEQSQVQIKVDGAFKFPQAKVTKFSCLEDLNDCYTIQATITINAIVPNLEQLLKKLISFQVILSKQHSRAFSGYISSIEYLYSNALHNTHTYEIKAKPELWWSSLNQRYRIFENKSITDIIKSLCSEHKIKSLIDKTQKAGKVKREYITQYSESDLNFFNRLLEEEGINYSFLPTKNLPELFLFDLNSICPELNSGTPSKAFPLDKGQELIGTILELKARTRASIAHTGAIDYNYTKARQKILSKSGRDLERLDSFAPFTYSATETDLITDYNKISQERENHNYYTGRSKVCEFAPGLVFNVTGGAKHINNKYILIQVEHKIINEETEDGEQINIYENSFIAKTVKEPLRPKLKTIKPIVNHTQTAKVIGPKDHNIYTDKLGRIKILFYWNNPDQPDDIKNASCWVRVTQSLAGNNFGSLFLPRVDQEVVVSFVNGNPNYPIVIGCVYNSANMPPYLPQNDTRSTIKTITIGDKSATPGYNEIRFDDKAQMEEIFIHAQKDLKEEIEDSHYKHIKSGNIKTELLGEETGDEEKILHKGSKKLQLLSKGAQKSSFETFINKGDKTLDINQGDIKTHVKQGNIEQTVDIGNIESLIKKGNRSLQISSGDYNLTLQNGNQEIQINGVQDIKISRNQKKMIGGNMEINVAGNVSLNAAGKIDAKSSSMSFTAGKIEFKAATEISFLSPSFKANVGLCDFNVGSIFSVKAGASYSVTTPSVVMNAAASCTITSAMTSIIGMVKLGS